MKKSLLITLSFTGILMASTPITTANPIDWADTVVDYSGNIQNYGGTFMDPTTEFWVTGEPDADADNNGYAWDSGDPDLVAGWKGNAPGEYITVRFDNGLADIPGDDLTVSCYGGQNSNASVLASTDGNLFIQIGTIGGGASGYIRKETFDFGGLFTSDVHYVKVERIANGANTGLFFDAFGGLMIPEPGTITLFIIIGGLIVLWQGMRFHGNTCH